MEQLREKVDAFDAHAREAQRKRKKWARQMDEACAVLLGEVEDPDEETDLIVGAISELLDEMP